MFERFKDMINNQYRGVMAEFNAYYQWGIYGKTRLNKLTARKENNNNNA